MENHAALSDFIKSVHQNLRDEAKILGTESAWAKHCSDEQKLEKYANAMQELAVKHWETNYGKNAKAVSRNLWIFRYCNYYFLTEEILKQRKKEEDIADKIGLKLEQNFWSNSHTLKLLDVGSCYNPFKEFAIFDVTAIDIAPANANVYKCDFLGVELNNKTIIKDKQILQLTTNFYDVVVFSLLLEYLPSPKQRQLCCLKAYELLKTEGILVIITPDSNHVGANAQLYKSWRYVLANIGFSRIKYEKLPHIHCMVFRKSLNPLIAQRWAELHKTNQTFEEMFIPQDFKEAKPAHVKEVTDFRLFNELPFFVE